MSKLREVSWHPGPFKVHADSDKEAINIAVEHLRSSMTVKLVEPAPGIYSRFESEPHP